MIVQNDVFWLVNDGSYLAIIAPGWVIIIAFILTLKTAEALPCFAWRCCPLSGTDFQRDKRWRRFWNWPSIDRPNEALRLLISFSTAPSQLKSLQLHSWGLPCFHWLPESLATSLQHRSSSNIWKVITWRSSTDLFTFTSCLYQSNSSCTYLSSSDWGDRPRTYQWLPASHASLKGGFCLQLLQELRWFHATKIRTGSHLLSISQTSHYHTLLPNCDLYSTVEYPTLWRKGWGCKSSSEIRREEWHQNLLICRTPLGRNLDSPAVVLLLWAAFL